MIDIIEEAFFHVLQWYVQLWGIALIYTWIKLILSPTIEDNRIFHSSLQKMLYYLLAVGMAAIASVAFGYMFGKSLYFGWVSFFALTPAALFAVYKLYKKEDSK